MKNMYREKELYNELKDLRKTLWLKAIPNYEKPEFTGDEVSDDGLYVKEKDE
jgi:hypothetical protein